VQLLDGVEADVDENDEMIGEVSLMVIRVLVEVFKI
jgi:hypothetical protein